MCSVAHCHQPLKRRFVECIRQRIENDWIESHFDKGPRIESEYNRFDAKNMKK
jgi:hypothetical protein